MAITNRERVDTALEQLRKGLGPYIKRELQRIPRNRLPLEKLKYLTDDPLLNSKSIDEWDASAMLRLMNDTWFEVFHSTLGYSGRTLASELRDWRNQWAHQRRFSSDDTDRVLDSTERMLAAISAPQAVEVGRMKMQLRRVVFDEQVRSEKQRKQPRLYDSVAGLHPWREVVEPHDDVANGRYQQAEFAADLGQVHRGEGVDEYRDPVEFFRRTYITGSLEALLVSAIRRLSGVGGDPVVQLQTNFGGGKTHTMLALYHLFSGIDAQSMSGLDKILEKADVSRVDCVRRVVLVGTQISPGSPETKSDGTVINTLWGQLAYQLGGRKAFEQVRVDDERATNPGDKLRQLLIDYGPCAILIDEWVSYARQLHNDRDLPGGTFETQFTFAQALSESIKLTDNCLLMVSLPASDQRNDAPDRIDDSEVGGMRGNEALERLRNVIARVESPWRPATAEEGFEIVRRRLFKPLSGSEAYKHRDVTARAFTDFYQAHRDEFPSSCQTTEYKRRIQAAYPIHPEVFDRLYTDWSSLAKFQRTRGVLRLMAAVIHSLWESDDNSPLIQPWNFRLADDRVRNELTRYLSDNWVPVIEKDIDGRNALPLAIDSDAPNLGKLHATRRVARVVYLGSAPITEAARRGIDDTRIMLGCARPGESAAVFGDALRRLTTKATYLYQDGNRYWYGTQATVAKLAEDRAEEYRRKPDDVAAELEKQIRDNLRSQDEFKRIHTFPKSAADVSDDHEARLVVLSAESPYSHGSDDAAKAKSQEILDSRGSTPRLYRNTLVFLAPDSTRLSELDDALRRFLAWNSIREEVETLNLDPHQARQVESQRKAAEAAVLGRIPETYVWLLVPVQETASSGATLTPLRLTGRGTLAERVSKRLLSEEMLVNNLGSTILRLHLDRVPLWRGDHVEVRQLVEDFARYLYLPRLKGPDVLVGAIRDGVKLPTWEMDAFALADSYDVDERRFRGLRYEERVEATPDSSGLLVKPTIAREQIDREIPPVPPPDQPTPPIEGERVIPEPIEPRRFHATATLNNARIGLEASRIAEEVVAHLNGLVGSIVRVTLEIEVTVSDGVPEDIRRVVTENSASLKLDHHAFEDS